MANLFDRLSRGRPQAAEKTQKPEPEPEKLLLDFLKRWPKPTISSRDIRIYGPGSIRNRESAIRSAQILAAHGWLIPLAERKWQVVRNFPQPTRSK